MHAAHTRTHIRSTACRSNALHCTNHSACPCNILSFTHSYSVLAVCCPRSTSSVVWIWRKDKLPLCFLIVLRVCSMNPHNPKCCAFSRDVAWHDCLGSWVSGPQADRVRVLISLIWSWWTENCGLWKSAFAIFPFDWRPIHAPISKTEKNVHGSSILSQMPKRNSSKEPLVSWLPSPEISHRDLQVVLALELQEERVHSPVLYL